MADKISGAEDGIIAHLFDGKGHARPLSASELAATPVDDIENGFLWVHLNRTEAKAIAWLKRAGLDRFIVDALTADGTRPRCTVHGSGALLNLRGVNLNPGAEPEDMVSVRLWIEARRVISVIGRPLVALNELMQAIKGETTLTTPGQLVANLALRLADNAEPTVAVLNEQIDALEEKVLELVSPASRDQLAAVRRTSIVLRRHMFPQRDALTTLEIEDLKWLHNRERSRLREAAERVTRLGEELDAIRDRAQVVHDQIMDKRAEAMNKQTLVLSVVAALFLPLSLITGLLGINVGGIPGSDSPYAFLVVCLMLGAIGAAQVWYFRRIGLF